MLRRLLLFSGLLAAVWADADLSSPPQFNAVPTNITAGFSYSLSWTPGDGNPVNITLMQGLTADVKAIGFIAVNINDTKFTWNTDTSYVNGDNYALMLSQDSSTTLSSTFSISGGVTIPSASTTASSQPASTGSANAGPATTASAAPAAPSHVRLTRGDVVGIVFGIVAICAGLSTMLIFLLVLSIMRKKGAEAAAAAAAEGRGYAGDDDDGTMSMTPLPSSTESPVVGTFYSKRVDDSTLGSSHSGGISSLSSSAPPRSRNGSAGSADLSPGSPATLVPPAGISLATSAANSRGGTMPGTPTGLHHHGISAVAGGAGGAPDYFKRPPSTSVSASSDYKHPRPPSTPAAMWDDPGRLGVQAVHPGAGSSSSLGAAAAPPPSGPLPAAPAFSLPPPHALGSDPWLQLPVHQHMPMHQQQQQQNFGGMVPPRRAVGLTPQGTGDSAASAGSSGSRRWSPTGPQGASKLRMQME